MYVCMYVSVYACMYVCVHVCMYIRMYAWVRMHICNVWWFVSVSKTIPCVFCWCMLVYMYISVVKWVKTIRSRCTCVYGVFACFMRVGCALSVCMQLVLFLNKNHTTNIFIYIQNVVRCWSNEYDASCCERDIVEKNASFCFFKILSSFVRVQVWYFIKRCFKLVSINCTSLFAVFKNDKWH